MISSYSKIYNFGHRAVANLLDVGVQVEEKLDGSQFSFGKINGVLNIRSKGAIINPYDPPKLFAMAVDTVLSLADKLPDGWVYRGEAICNRKHNSITYDRVPTGGVMIFDVEGPFGPNGSQDFLRAESRRDAAMDLGLECVPVIFMGMLTPDQFGGLIKRESVLGGAQIEGVVVKPIQYDQWGTDKRVLMMKHVREDFRELNRENWTGNANEVDKIVDRYRSVEARWVKAVQSLRDSGELLGEPKDIGPLMKRVTLDVYEEEADAIKEALFKHFWKLKISRATVAGLAEWYKDLLVLDQFENKE